MKTSTYPKSNLAKIKQAGFTLLEIMIVVGIIGVLVALLAGGLGGKRETAEIQATKARITQVVTDIESYRINAMTYPGSLNDLVTRPGNVRAWVKLEDRVPEDAWAEPFMYKYPGTHNPSKYDVYSKGPDKKEGTDDDIGNW